MSCRWESSSQSVKARHLSNNGLASGLGRVLLAQAPFTGCVTQAVTCIQLQRSKGTGTTGTTLTGLSCSCSAAQSCCSSLQTAQHTGPPRHPPTAETQAVLSPPRPTLCAVPRAGSSMFCPSHSRAPFPPECGQAAAMSGAVFGVGNTDCAFCMLPSHAEITASMCVSARAKCHGTINDSITISQSNQMICLSASSPHRRQ